MFCKLELKDGRKVYVNEASVAYVDFMQFSETASWKPGEKAAYIYFVGEEVASKEFYGEDVELVRRWVENLSYTVTDELS